MKKRLLKIGMWIFGVCLSLFLLISGGLYFFKDEICGLVIEQVNHYLKAKVKVAEVDVAFWGSFPNLSVDFEDVFIQDSYLNSTFRDTLLFSERIRLKFNPIDIWNEKYKVKGISVSPGTIQIKTNEKGEGNFDILKESSDTSATEFQFDLKMVNLEGIRFLYSNQKTSQHYSTQVKDMELSGAFSEREFTLHSKSTLFIDEIKSGTIALIRNKPAAFDLNIKVNQLLQTVEIPKAVIYLSNLPFTVRGKVEGEKINFRIVANELSLQDVASNFSHSSIDQMKQYEGKGKVDFDLKLSGFSNADEPLTVNCNFGIENGELVDRDVDLYLKNINLIGRYSNKGGREKEFLNLSKVSFSTAGGPFYGNLLLTNFENPLLNVAANGHLDLKVLHQLFPFQRIEEINGQIDLQSQFILQVFPQLNGESIFDVKMCEGNIAIHNSNLKLKEDKRWFNEVEGSIYLRGSQLGMDHISLKVGDSDLKIDGVFNNLFMFLRDEEKLDVAVDIYSKFLNIQDLGTETKEEQISDGRDWLMPSNLKGSISLSVDDINYEQHHFKKLKTTLQLGNRLLQFSDLTLYNSNALIQGSVQVEEQSPEMFTISTQLTSNNMEFKSLFKEWNNFDQTVIAEDNISGKAQLSLVFSAPFDLRSGIIKNAIKAKIDMRILEGRLRNVSTFQSIVESMKSSSAKLVLTQKQMTDFSNRLSDLKFETLENTFTIQNGKLEIPLMKIQSNALDMELYGSHGFDEQIDYHFAFRFREIKSQKTQSEFGTEIDDESGLRIFIRMYGDLNDPIIEWDKSAKKEQVKENREAAKQDAKSIFKSEFGLFKGDSTVKTYQQEKKPKEELKIEYGSEKDKSKDEDKKERKETKIGNTLKKWKEQSEKEKKEGFEVGD